MVTKTFLITSTELAAHTREKQQLVFDMLNAAHEAYPELTIPQLLEYTQQWVSSVAEGEETWDYVDGLANLLGVTEDTTSQEEPEEEEIEEVTIGLQVEDFTTEAEPVAYDTSAETIIEETVVEELPVENDTEEDNELLDLDDDNEEADFYSNIESSSTVSRQKRYNGLLQEAGKLDH